MTRRIALLGLSGVGKSTMLGKLAKQVRLTHLEASELIKAEQARRLLTPQSSEALRTGPVLENQALLIAGFGHAAAATELPIVFDGHSIIDGHDGLVEIPAAVFAALGIETVIFLQAEPSVIHARRKNDVRRTRPQRTIDELTEHQSRAMTAAKGIADTLACPFAVMTSEDADKLAEYLKDSPR